MSVTEGKKASAQGSNYHENITAPPLGEDDGIVSHEETDDNNFGLDKDVIAETADGVLSAIEKASILCSTHASQVTDRFWQLRKVAKAVHSSPQCHQSWACEIQFIQAGGNSMDLSGSLMLILDMRTRWSSTYQMLHMC